MVARRRDAIEALLEWAAEVDLTAEEAEEELRREGVDVPGFLARVEERIAQARMPPVEPASGIRAKAPRASSWPPPPFPRPLQEPPVRHDSGAIAIDLTQASLDEE